jgi:hypothetical protein
VIDEQNLTPCPEHFNMLCGALEHIAKTARASRSQTRRIRWIEARAIGALRGQQYERDAIDLPRDAGPNTVEKLKKKLAVQTQINRQLTAAAELALRDCGALIAEPAGYDLALAVANARAPGGIDADEGGAL